MQVENGLGAAMYGPANPSGMFDFVLKRPTEERTTNLYLEQDSSSVGTIYGDAGEGWVRIRSSATARTFFTEMGRSSSKKVGSVGA
jgi:hypothetical protein